MCQVNLRLTGVRPRLGSGHKSDRGESRRGISPPRAPRTVREPLDSYGSRCSAVGPQRLHPTAGAPPIAGWPWPRGRTTQPLRSGPITELSSLLRAAPPLCSASVLSPLWGPPTWTSPFASERQVPKFRTRARIEVTPPPCRMPLSQKSGRPPSLSRSNDDPPVLTSSIRFRHVISGSLSLVSSIHT